MMRSKKSFNFDMRRIFQMDSGSLAYLALVIICFFAFAGTLAMVSRR